MTTMSTGTSTGHQLIRPRLDRRPGSVGTGLTAFDRDTGRDRVRVDHLGQVAHSAMLAEAVTGTRSLSMPTLRLLVADAQATG